MCNKFCDKIEEVDGWLPTIRGFQNHLRLWRRQQESYMKNVQLPDPNTLYLACDFADPHHHLDDEGNGLPRVGGKFIDIHF